MSTLPTPPPSLEIPATRTRPPSSRTPIICPPRWVLRSPPRVHPPRRGGTAEDGDPGVAAEGLALPWEAGKHATDALSRAQVSKACSVFVLVQTLRTAPIRSSSSS